MRIRTYNLIVLTLVLFTLAIAPKACADAATGQEYKLKAAFLYNFIKFVDWPEEKLPDGNEPITIGIIGKDPFGAAFEPIKNKQVKSRKVIIRRFMGLEELKKSGEKEEDELHKRIEEIRKCQLLFICRSEKEKLERTIDLVKGHNVLMVGDMQAFLEKGGIIKFIMEENKVRFEINITAARHAELKIRSQLLRLAKRIVEEKPSHEAKS